MSTTDIFTREELISHRRRLAKIAADPRSHLIRPVWTGRSHGWTVAVEGRPYAEFADYDTALDAMKEWRLRCPAMDGRRLAVVKTSVFGRLAN